MRTLHAPPTARTETGPLSGAGFEEDCGRASSANWKTSIKLYKDGAWVNAKVALEGLKPPKKHPRLESKKGKDRRAASPADERAQRTRPNPTASAAAGPSGTQTSGKGKRKAFVPRTAGEGAKKARKGEMDVAEMVALVASREPIIKELGEKVRAGLGKIGKVYSDDAFMTLLLSCIDFESDYTTMSSVGVLTMAMLARS